MPPPPTAICHFQIHWKYVIVPAGAITHNYSNRSRWKLEGCDREGEECILELYSWQAIPHPSSSVINHYVIK